MQCRGCMVDDYDISRKIAPGVVLWHERLKGGVTIERDLVLYEHHTVPFSDGYLKYLLVLYSTSLHVLIPVV
jgi:hypothetical protein